MNKVSQLLNDLTYLEEKDVNDFLIKLITESTQATTIGFLNQHGFNLMVKSPDIKKSFTALDHIFRDGIGIKLACKYKGLPPGANLNGTDLIPQIITLVKQYTSPLCFALGTEKPWLDTGAKELYQTDEVYTLDGFQPNERYVEFVQNTLAAHDNNSDFPIIVLAMGMPKQESVAAALKQVINKPCLIICGGAIIDFKANRFKRAPAWMRANGLEWMYRLLSEPSRLFKRYAIGIPLFFSYLILNK
jgi:beta-1,4-glucosyltransferase